MTEIRLPKTNEHVETIKTYLNTGDFKKLSLETNDDEMEVI